MGIAPSPPFYFLNLITVDCTLKGLALEPFPSTSLRNVIDIQEARRALIGGIGTQPPSGRTLSRGTGRTIPINHYTTTRVDVIEAEDVGVEQCLSMNGANPFFVFRKEEV